MKPGIKHLFDAAVEELEKVYPVEEASSIIRILFNDVLGISRTQLALEPRQILEVEQMDILHTMLAKLLKGQPVQQVIGHGWFMGMQFRLNRHVLIPRPETEELLHWIIDTEKKDAELHILDIGTGSGCIAVSLAKAFTNASVTGIDKSQDALEVARINGISNQADVDFINMDILKQENWKKLSLLDIIVSNPPYVLESDKAMMHKNVLEYEPHIALFVKDNDPLLFYKAISDLGLKYLDKGGRLFFEIHESFGEAMLDMLIQKGYTHTELKQDIHGKDRMVRAVKP